MKNIILYIRVSTKEQEKKGFSLQSQEKLLREAFKDYNIVDVIHDVTSGMKVERDGITKLRGLLHTTNYVGVLDQDRLSRSLENLGVIKYWCKNENVKIKCVDIPDDSKLVSGIKAVVATDEIEKLVKRIARGKDEAYAMGRHIACPPMGYRYDKGVKPSKLIQDDKISIVVNIFRLRKEKRGYLYIAKNLNLKSKNGTYATIRVKTILENPFYAGFVKYKGQIKKGIHQSIISEDEFFSINSNEKYKKMLELK